MAYQMMEPEWCGRMFVSCPKRPRLEVHARSTMEDSVHFRLLTVRGDTSFFLMR